MLSPEQIAALDGGGGHACTPEEYGLLGALVALTAPAAMLEIGTSTGIGALVMASAARDRDPAARVTTIDLPYGRETFGGALARNLAAVDSLQPGLSASIDFIVEDSAAVLPRLAAAGRRFSFVFIDGGHRFDEVRRDWDGVLALVPDMIVLHDSVHLADVARFVDSIRDAYAGVTITYPRRAVPGGGSTAVGPGSRGPTDGAGLTIFSGLATVETARGRSARRTVPAAHEVAARLEHERVLDAAHVRRAFAGQPFAGRPSPRPAPVELEIIVTGRNDGYGGPDFHERMVAAAAFNHARLTEAGVSHRFTLVEWNPPPDRPLLSTLLSRALPWWHRSLVVSPAWHAWLSENPRLQFMEFFAKNAGIRRAEAPWLLTTNSDVFLSRDVVARLAGGRLEPGTLYRASRLDMDRDMPWAAMSWALLEQPRYLLRRHDPEPPYYNEAAGDFLLLDRESYHALGGFNERIRFSKIDKDGQFCLQAHHRGLAIKWIGPIYHLDHDGSFINTKHSYQPDFSDAPFGPRWESWQPYWNREDWGLTSACEQPDAARGFTWLRTPEEAGCRLSVVILGDGDPAPWPATIASLRACRPDVETIVVNAAPAWRAAVPEGEGLRVLTAAADTPAAALNVGLAHGRGRFLTCLPGPVDADGLGDTLAGLPHDDGPAVLLAPAGPEHVPITIVSRRAFDRLGGLDPLAGDWAAEFHDRAVAAFGSCPAPPLSALAPAPSAWGRDPSVERAWRQMAAAPGSGSPPPVPVLVAADFQHRAEKIVEALVARLRRELPDEARYVAVWGVGALTPLAIAALRAMGRHVTGVYAPEPQALSIAGQRVQGGAELDAELDADGATWVVSTAASPADAIAVQRRVPAARLVHLVEAGALRAPSPPFASAPAIEGLAQARALRDAGELDRAVRAYRAMLRDPACADVPTVLYELALIAVRQGDAARADRLFRWLIRHWPAQRSVLFYNRGSFYRAQGRLDKARRDFERVAGHAAGEPPDRLAGCHFHLGEIALACRDEAAAVRHFTAALEHLPGHGRARARLEELGGRRAAGS